MGSLGHATCLQQESFPVLQHADRRRRTAALIQHQGAPADGPSRPADCCGHSGQLRKAHCAARQASSWEEAVPGQIKLIAIVNWIIEPQDFSL